MVLLYSADRGAVSSSLLNATSRRERGNASS